MSYCRLSVLKADTKDKEKKLAVGKKIKKSLKALTNYKVTNQRRKLNEN